MTSFSSGETATEHVSPPVGKALGPGLDADQLWPVSTERWWPSVPQMSTMSPDCASTSQIRRAFVAGSGSTWDHVNPELVLTAIPHAVPTKTLVGSSGSMLMPNADG